MPGLAEVRIRIRNTPSRHNCEPPSTWFRRNLVRQSARRTHVR